VSQVRQVSRLSRWLHEKKRMCWVFVGMMFTIMFVMCLVDLANPGQGKESLSIVFTILIISGLVSFYFIINGFRVLSILRKNSKTKSTARNVRTLILRFAD
jgi:uncharacterized membrane protein